MYLYSDMGFVISAHIVSQSASNEIYPRPPFTGIKSYICTALNKTKSSDAEDFIYENR